MSLILAKEITPIQIRNVLLPELKRIKVPLPEVQLESLLSVLLREPDREVSLWDIFKDLIDAVGIRNQPSVYLEILAADKADRLEEYEALDASRPAGTITADRQGKLKAKLIQSISKTKDEKRMDILFHFIHEKGITFNSYEVDILVEQFSSKKLLFLVLDFARKSGIEPNAEVVFRKEFNLASAEKKEQMFEAFKSGDVSVSVSTYELFIEALNFSQAFESYQMMKEKSGELKLALLKKVFNSLASKKDCKAEEIKLVYQEMARSSGALAEKVYEKSIQFASVSDTIRLYDEMKQNNRVISQIIEDLLLKKAKYPLYADPAEEERFKDIVQQILDNRRTRKPQGMKINPFISNQLSFTDALKALDDKKEKKQKIDYKHYESLMKKAANFEDAQQVFNIVNTNYRKAVRENFFEFFIHQATSFPEAMLVIENSKDIMSTVSLHTLLLTFNKWVSNFEEALALFKYLHEFYPSSTETLDTCIAALSLHRQEYTGSDIEYLFDYINRFTDTKRCKVDLKICKELIRDFLLCQHARILCNAVFFAWGPVLQENILLGPLSRDHSLKNCLEYLRTVKNFVTITPDTLELVGKKIIYRSNADAELFITHYEKYYRHIPLPEGIHKWLSKFGA